MTAVRLQTDGPDDPLANVLGSDESPVLALRLMESVPISCLTLLDRSTAKC